MLTKFFLNSKIRTVEKNKRSLFRQCAVFKIAVDNFNNLHTALKNRFSEC